MTKEIKKREGWVKTPIKEWNWDIEVAPTINLFGIISLSLTKGRLDKNPENWSEDDKKMIGDFLTKENLKISLEEFSNRLKEEIKQISEENFKRILDEMDVRPKKTFEIQYFPEDHCPPNVAAFVNRSAEQTNLEKLIRRPEKHMILILGIAGIGKTQISAKLLENIKTGYITYWKEMYKVDTFYTVTKNLAGFLRDNNDSELANYIEDAGTDRENIINILLSSLKKKQYALFFDNYQEVENEEVHYLFTRFKDRLTNSTIIITTTWKSPQFVTPVDDENVVEETVRGFDSGSTRDYLERKGLEISEEQLVKIDEKMGGHPNCLKLFASCVSDKSDTDKSDTIDEILENLPDTEVFNWFYDTCYDNLPENERKVLETLSVFRTAVTADACVQVSETTDGSIILRNLIRKLLVERRGNLHYLHDSIRELSYNSIDDPKEYHKRAGEYYSSLEKTPENILETAYHLIKCHGEINDEIINYLIDAPKDFYTSMVVLDILLGNAAIKSNKIIDLLNEFVAVDNINVLQSFANTLGDFFIKINKKDRKHIFELIDELLKKDDPQILTGIVRSSDVILKLDPKPMLPHLEKLFSKKSRLDFYIIQYIVESQYDTDEGVALLKKALDRYRERGNLRYKMALGALKKWGIEVDETDYIIPINQLRGKTTDELVEILDKLIEEGKDISLDFSLLILNQIAEERPEATSKLLKKIVGLSSDTIPRLFRIDRVLAKAIVKSSGSIEPLIEPFINDSNGFSKFVGLRALDLIKEERRDITKKFMMPLTEDPDQLLRFMAEITLEEAEEEIGEQTKTKSGGGIIDRIKIALDDIKNYQRVYIVLKGQISKTEPRQFYTVNWILKKSVEKSDPEKIVRILDALGLKNQTIKDIVKWSIGTTKSNPKTMISLFDKFVLTRGTLDDKIVGIFVIGELGCLAPQKACKILNQYRSKDEYSFIREFALWALIKIYEAAPKEAEEYLKEFLNDSDENLKMIANVALNGIDIVSET